MVADVGYPDPILILPKKHKIQINYILCIGRAAGRTARRGAGAIAKHVECKRPGHVSFALSFDV